MNELTKILSDETNDNNHNDTLFVNNIIVKKNDVTKNCKTPTYIATERWIMQLGQRLIA